MSQSILLRGAKQLLTLRGKPGVRRGTLFGNLEIIEDGSVFIQDGKIASVGPTRRLENLKEIRSALIVPVQNCIVMPAFVDPCIQLSLLAPHANPNAHPKRRKLADFYNQSISLLRACLQHGTLNVGIQAASGVHSLGADISMLRQLARIRNNPVGITRIWCPDADSLPEPHSKAWDNALDTIVKRKLADAIAVKPHIRLNPIAARAPNRVSIDWTGSDAEKLAELMQGSSPPAIFCRHTLTPAERDTLAAAGCAAVFSAASSMFDGLPTHCIRELVEAGGAVALGSGYHAQYEPNFNMQLVLALAVRRLGLTIEQAITAATINAAYAINCGDQIGSLEPGKRAEILVLNLSDYREIPRRMGVNHVAIAIRDGVIVMNRTRWRAGAA